MMAGYAHPAYARSLRGFGDPLHLPRSEGWLLKRAIEGFDASDAMGCYPLFSCQDWQSLPDDLEELREGLVSVVLVTDPFLGVDPASSAGRFDVLAPFKEHMVVDLGRAPDTFVSSHHRRNIRKAARNVEVEVCEAPSSRGDEWVVLYQRLIARHGIRGIARFSPESLREQLRVPGTFVLRAVRGDETVGMSIWYLRGSVAYYHLAAYSDLGYRVNASFPLFASAIGFFAERAAWLSLGAGAGFARDGTDGLTRFKSGWATGTRTAYLAGRVLNSDLYSTIVQARNPAPSSYFPSYRQGEFD